MWWGDDNIPRFRDYWKGLRDEYDTELPETEWRDMLATKMQESEVFKHQLHDYAQKKQSFKIGPEVSYSL